MSKLVKKIVVSAVVAAMVATVAVPTAQAQTAAELQAQIQALLNTIAQLQAQISSLSGGTTGGVTGIPAGFTFTRNLSQGSSGSDVMYLQVLLNANAATRVATTGVGSPGQETQFFGPLTANAVSRFQTTYASEVLAPLGLTSGTGFFGASSRAKANMLVASGAVPTPTPTSGATATPTPSGITTPGVEGSLVVTINSSPASGAILNTGETEAVTAVDVKATGSDVLVSRLDLQFNARPWLYVQEMTVSDGTNSKTVAVTESNSVEVTVGTTYYVRVGDLSILVPKDATKKITVTVKAVTGMPVGDTTQDIILTHIADSVRGTDGAGLTQTGPTASLSTRTITVQEPSTADLELTAHADNPVARAVLVNQTAETTGVTLAVFNLKAKNNDAILRTLEYRDTDGIATSASNAPSVVYLYDGSTLLSSTSTYSGASGTLTNINLTIPKDTTKTLTLKADLRKASGNFAEGATSTVIIGAHAQSINAEDGTSFAAATVSGSGIQPGTSYFYIKAPKIVLASTPTIAAAGGLPSGSTGPQTLNGEIKFAITAQGGDIYIPVYSATAASTGLQASSALRHEASITVTQTFSSDADYGSTANDTYVVRSGTTKTFTLNGSITGCGAASPDAKIFNGINLNTVRWGTSVATAQQPSRTWTWGLTSFITPQLELLPCQ